MEKMNGESLNIVADNITKLKQIFPEVFNQDKVDFEKLEQVLGEYKDTNDERYSFTWPGKAQAIRIAQTPSMGTLRPCKGESVDWDETENLYIEGDNLEVLKLLQKSYYGKVKMIYIDPPYNTGNDFVYEDNYKDNITNYLEITGQVDEDGKKTSTNSDISGRYHSNWASMIYPRLKLAKNLLSEDGVILISLDDNEAHNIRKICDEIYGENNFVTTICHKARASVSNDKIISSNHNLIFLYAKNQEVLFKERSKIGLDPDLEGFNNPDNDPRGPYKMTPVDGPGGAKKGNPYYEFLGVEGYFRYSKETMQKKYEDGLIVKTAKGLQQKYYLEQAKQSRKTDTTWWEDAGLTSNATKDLIKLMGKKTFDTPKPVSLVKRMLKLFTSFDKEAIILDFFGGSSTTAHAVMEMNSEDNGARKYILVQLPEMINEKTDAFEAGYRKISEIGIERIKKAIGLMQHSDIDKGVKVFKLDSSNIKSWDPVQSENIEEQLFNMVNNIKEDRSEEDILFEILLKYGVDLNAPIEEQRLADKKVYAIGFGAIIACLADNITLEVVEAIGKLKEELDPGVCRVVFRDKGFVSDAVKTNAVQILKRYDIHEVKSI